MARDPEVLRDISFSLEPGSFTFLTGLSGAGKTTLLKLIYVAEPPSRGLITLFGAELATARRRDFPGLRRRIGVVFQDFRLLDHLSAFDNVALPLRLAGKRVSDFTHDVSELLSWVGLGDRMQARPPTLSGGEQQRVAIARAVVARPRPADRRRTDRQCRPGNGRQADPADRRTQPPGHHRSDRHPRPCPDRGDAGARDAIDRGPAGGIENAAMSAPL